MKHMLDRLSGKPEAGDDEDAHAAAKMQVLHELRNMAMGMMGDKVKGKMPGHEIHEVDVAAPDAASLHKGLGLAQALTKKGPLGPPHSLNADRDSSMGESLDSHEPHQGSNGSEMDDAAGEVEEEHAEGRNEPDGDQGEPDDDDMSHDEIDSMIEELQAKKRAMPRKV
jgi:hypothetical protein